MNPLPPMVVPTEVVPVSAYADPILLAVVAALAVIFALMLWSMRSSLQRRERRICPEQLRAATVRLALGPHGNPVDVLRCSLLGPGPVICSKDCIAVRPV